MDPITCTSSYLVYTSKEKGSFQDTVNRHPVTHCAQIWGVYSRQLFFSHATRRKLTVPKNQHRIELWKFGDIWGVVLPGFFAEVTSMFSRQIAAFPQVSAPACYVFMTEQLPWREQRAVAGRWGLAQAPQPVAGLVPAFSFLPQQLAPSDRHRRLVWAPAEVRQGEEKTEEKMLVFFLL